MLLDQQKFCEVLLKHIFKSLTVKKEVESPAYKPEWAIREAFNAEALHKSGSYINVLLLKLDSVVANTLRNILSAVDQYYNLHLLQSKAHAILSLWLKIYEDTQIILELTNVLPDTTIDHSKAAFASFKCHFPFFWLIANNIESQWKVSSITSKH